MEVIQLMATKVPQRTNNEIEVCVLPEGKFSEKDWFGDERLVGYTKKDIAEMVNNFRKGLPHYSPFLNIGHTNEKLTEVKAVYQVSDDSDKQNGLWAVMEVDEDIYKTAKKYGYVSGEVYDDYLDADGESHGKVFAGLALTNRPRHKRIQKNKFEELIDKMRNVFSLVEDYPENKPEGWEEDMTNKEFEEKIEAQKKEFETQLSEKQKELEKLQTELYTGKVNIWKAEKAKEGYTPANINKFADKLTNSVISFEVANEFIAMTEKVEEEQIVGSAKFTEDEKKESLEDMGRNDAKKMAEGEF